MCWLGSGCSRGRKGACPAQRWAKGGAGGGDSPSRHSSPRPAAGHPLRPGHPALASPPSTGTVKSGRENSRLMINVLWGQVAEVSLPVAFWGWKCKVVYLGGRGCAGARIGPHRLPGSARWGGGRGSRWPAGQVSRRHSALGSLVRKKLRPHPVPQSRGGKQADRPTHPQTGPASPAIPPPGH